MKTSRTSASNVYRHVRHMSRAEFKKVRSIIKRAVSQSIPLEKFNPEVWTAIGHMEQPDNLYHWENWSACLQYYEKKF